MIPSTRREQRAFIFGFLTAVGIGAWGALVLHFISIGD